MYPVKPISTRDFPESLSGEGGDLECSSVRKYEIFPSPLNTKDYFSLAPEEQKSLLNRMNRVFTQVEKTRPAAGYEVHLVGSNTGSNSMELTLHAVGDREAGSPIEMPIKPSCLFCNKVSKKDQMEGFEELDASNARVIKTLQGNALVISSEHREHFLANTVEEQQDMLLAAKKVIDFLKMPGSPRTKEKTPHNYELRFHCGSIGHQKIPHSHGHVLIGTNIPLGARTIS